MGTERRYLLIGMAVIALGAMVGGQRILPRTRPVRATKWPTTISYGGFVDALQVIDDSYGQNPDKNASPRAPSSACFTRLIRTRVSLTVTSSLKCRTSRAAGSLA